MRYPHEENLCMSGPMRAEHGYPAESGCKWLQMARAAARNPCYARVRKRAEDSANSETGKHSRGEGVRTLLGSLCSVKSAIDSCLNLQR